MTAKTYLLACVFLAAPGLAAAQPGGAIVDRNRPDRAAPQAPPSGQPLPRPSRGPQITLPAGAAAVLSGVDVQGSTLPHAAIVAAMQPFLGRRLDQPTVQAAADALAVLYAKSPVALYEIQAPQQDLAGGRLQLRVIEGRVAQVAIHGDVSGREVALVKAYGAKLADETPLTRRTLERELSLIGDIPGLKTTPQLLQGGRPGDVVVGLDLDPTRSEIDLSVLNSGNPRLGRVQLQADVNLYSVLRGGDATRLTVLVPTDVERLQYYALTHSQPLGDDGLRAQVSAGYLRTRPSSGPGDGDATVASLQLSYPLIRSYRQNLVLTADLDGIDSSNAVLGNIPSRETTRAGRLAAAWSLQRPTQAFLAAATGSYGSTELGGSTPAGAADDPYRKLNLRLGYDQGLGPRWVVRAKAIAQISGDRLPPSELISIGGDDFGRAFPQSTLLGDEARAGALELAFRPIVGAQPLAGSELYVFADTARVTVAGRFGGPGASASLGSAGLGVRAVWKQKTVLGLEGAYATDAPAIVGKGAWRFGFTLRTVR